MLLGHITSYIHYDLRSKVVKDLHPFIKVLDVLGARWSAEEHMYEIRIFPKRGFKNFEWFHLEGFAIFIFIILLTLLQCYISLLRHYYTI